MPTHRHFEIELTEAGGNSPPDVVRLNSEADVLDFVKAHLRPSSELFVACLGDRVDFGNFIIDLDQEGVATVTAHEHRGFFVKGVSKSQAIEALEYWLPLQSRSTQLHWEEQ